MRLNERERDGQNETESIIVKFVSADDEQNWPRYVYKNEWPWQPAAMAYDDRSFERALRVGHMCWYRHSSSMTNEYILNVLQFSPTKIKCDAKC